LNSEIREFCGHNSPWLGSRHDVIFREVGDPGLAKEVFIKFEAAIDV